MKNVTLAFLLGFVLFGCGGTVTTETSSAEGGNETTTSNSGGSGGSDEGGSGGATTTDSTTDSGGEGGGMTTTDSTTDTGSSSSSDDCSNLPAIAVNTSPDNPSSSDIMLPTSGTGLSVQLADPVNGMDIKVTSATICQTDPNGDAADFNGVFMSHDLDTFMIGQTADGSCWTLVPTANAFQLAPGDTKKVWAGGVAAKIFSSAAANGAWYGVARSGHTPKLELKDITISRLDGSCTTQVNVGLSGPQMLLRKSQPIVTSNPLPTTTLADDDQAFFSIEICSDFGGPVAIKRWSTVYTKQGAVNVKSIRLRKGGADMPFGSYKILVSNMGFPGQDSIESWFGNGTISIDLTSEEPVNGCEFYTLHGLVSGAVPGASLTVGFEPEAAGVITETLAFGPYATYGLTDANDPNVLVFASFLWSDMSEVPHQDFTGSLPFQHGGSKDWTSGYLVWSLLDPASFTQILSL